MASIRQKQHNKKKSNVNTIPQLTTAQLTFNKTNTVKQQENINAKQVLQQVQQLWFSNQCLQAINLLKGLREYLKNTKSIDNSMQAIININLGVCYYKAGFLQESYDQFVGANASIKDLSLLNRMNTNQGSSYKSKLPQKLRYDMLTTRIQLQNCILFSQMGKHQLALQHAKLSCKLAYNTIYDLQIALYTQLNILLSKNKVLYSPSSQNQIHIQGQQNLLNNISVLNHLIYVTKDLKIGFLSKQKAMCYNDQVQNINRYGKFSTRLDLDLLYGKMQNQSVFWVYKNKILDQILIKYMKIDKIINDSKIIQQNQVIQKIVFLAISLYCYSTQTRFLQKSKQQTGDPSQVLDSQHWLSRSLQIAYSFLPSQAPILSQILTVHDRFHGIDKQTIPQDKEVGGFFKVLRPLSKPKSTYSAKNIMCSPIMIRIQVPKINIYSNTQQQKEQSSPKKIQFANKTIDLDNLTKNNKIRGLNVPKKFDFTQYSQSTIRHKPQNKTDFTQNIKSIYATRKIKSVAQHQKPQRMKINLSGLSGNSISQQQRNNKSMRRPHSYDKQINSRLQQQSLQIQTQRKKKSLSLHKKQVPRQKRKTTSLNSTGLKLDGLQMLPNNIKKIQDQQCFQFSQKMSTNMQTTKIGGNIFINNNINLFISKDNIDNNGNNGRTLTTKMKGDKTVYQISRRQNFMNKRKAHQSNTTGVKNPQFL